jgi:ParB-like chromosome segregation protein Spo0J
MHDRLDGSYPVVEQRPNLSFTQGSGSQGVPAEDTTRIATVVDVHISMICPADSPRFVGTDVVHAQALADSEAELPPILVRRSTLQVIDGMHRLAAAQMRGQEHIRVQFFDGDEHEAFLLAVESNVRHGLPLTIAERRAAASRILSSHPQMSDRSIAAVSGIAAKTVAAIRSATDADPHLNTRVGRDGRVRPLNQVEGRRLAGELMEEQPEASLRDIARQAGISLGTARDVRERLRRGETATLPPRQNAGEADAIGASGPAGAQEPRERSTARPAEDLDVKVALEHLVHDPSMRYNESGRSLLRWLTRMTAVDDDWEEVLSQIPPHCAILVAQVARGSAAAWSGLAEALDQRAQDCA